MASSENATPAVVTATANEAINLSVTDKPSVTEVTPSKEPTEETKPHVVEPMEVCSDNSESKPSEEVNSDKAIVPAESDKTQTPDIPTSASIVEKKSDENQSNDNNSSSAAVNEATKPMDADDKPIDVSVSPAKTEASKDSTLNAPVPTSADTEPKGEQNQDKKDDTEISKSTALSVQDKTMAVDETGNKDKSETPTGATTNGDAPSSAIATPVTQTTPVSRPIATIKPMVEPAASSTPVKTNNKRPAEDSNEPDKRMKTMSSSSSLQMAAYKASGGKTPDQVLEYMGKTFEQRRKIITKQMPTIPELKELYPELFREKQLVIEFQRITKIDIDQKIQEFCVLNATAVIEMARNKKGAQPVLARWEQAKQENEALRQYWDMVTALCLLPLHFGENFVEMVLEIGENEEVQAQGKIVPTLVARGSIFRTDEFFLIAENTIVQEFEEFTIAFASLYSSYWVFNMVYPETIENTYNFIQRCIVKQKEPGAIPNVCKNFTKSLQKWNKSMKSNT